MTKKNDSFYPHGWNTELHIDTAKFVTKSEVATEIAVISKLSAKITDLEKELLDGKKKIRYNQLCKLNIHSDQEINRIIEKEFNHGK